MSEVELEFHRRKKLSPSRVYTSREVASILGIKRIDALHLLNNGELNGKRSMRTIVLWEKILGTTNKRFII